MHLMGQNGTQSLSSNGIVHTVDMILMTVIHGKLMIVLEKDDKDHTWCLPSVQILQDEDMEEAVQKMLSQDLVMSKQTYFCQLYTFGTADRLPHCRTIATAYLTLTPCSDLRELDLERRHLFEISKKAVHVDEQGRESQLVLTDGIDTMQFQIIDKAKNNYIETRSYTKDSSAILAYDHIKAVNMAMDEVYYRAASTGILFNLLPMECTLREIQDVYEAVIGSKTDTGNFRRDIKRMLRETGHTKKKNGHTAKLYAFDPMYTYLKGN